MRWVVGDIHGMLRPLRALLDLIGAKDASAQFLFVGDYVNRGPDSRGVIDLLLSLQGAGVARFVRGNHDDILDLILHNRSLGCHPDACNPVAAFTWFVNYGLENTLYSYGVDMLDVEWARHHPTDASVRRLFEPLPAAHRAFIRSLPAVIEEPDLFVAHAMWHPDDADEGPPIAERLVNDVDLRHRVLWGRYGTNDITRRKRWRRTGFFGHTPVAAFDKSLSGGRNEPIRGPNMVLLDTGAALSANGRLSAVCADTGEAIQVERSGAPVEAE